MSDPVLQQDQANSLDLAVEVVKENATWADMLVAFDGMMAANVDAPIQELEILRYLGPLTDLAQIQNTVRLLGFDASQDVLSMSSGNLLRLVTQLPLYPDYNSTILFENFIDLLLNSMTKVEYLYTKDYVNFYPYPKGKLVVDGGTWFKTTHINVELELLKAETIDVSPGSKSIYRRILDVFYAFCPAALVIENLFFTITYKLDVGYAAVLLPYDLEVVIDH